VPRRSFAPRSGGIVATSLQQAICDPGSAPLVSKVAVFPSGFSSLLRLLHYFFASFFYHGINFFNPFFLLLDSF
jgi:hypothetical protein